MITFEASFDDGCALDMRVADLLEKYGFEDAVFYIPSYWQMVNVQHGDEPLSPAQLKDLAQRFRIGSHTMTHPKLTRIPMDQVKDEIIRSKMQLEHILGIDINEFCYPRGYANNDIRELVGQNYARARNTLVGEIYAPENPIWQSTAVHIAGNNRKEYRGTTWLAEALQLLADAEIANLYGEEDVVYHFWGHSWEIDRNNAWDDFEEFLKIASEVKNAGLYPL